MPTDFRIGRFECIADESYDPVQWYCRVIGQELPGGAIVAANIENVEPDTMDIALDAWASDEDYVFV